MRLQRVNRTDPERIFATVGNYMGQASIVGCVAYWGLADHILTASLHGAAVTGCTGDSRATRRLAGVWAQAVANGSFGDIQVWGLGDVYVVTAGTAPQHGDVLHADITVAHTVQTTGLATTAMMGLIVGARSAAAMAAVEAAPHVLVISATTPGALNAGFIRCLH